MKSEMGHINDVVNQTQIPRKKSFLRKLAVLAIAGLLFATGLAIGRGDLRFQKNPSASEKLDYSSVDSLYNVLKDEFDGQLNEDNLLNGVKEGLVEAAGDPYTEYLDPQEAKDFNQQLSGSFTGIGAELGTDDDKNIVIVSPLSGYPAEKAGLKPKDIIAGINDESASGLSVSEAVRKIRGPEGTNVKLTIIRGNGAPFEVTLTRTKITIPSVESSVENNIGYLKISQFTSDTASLATKAARDFKSKGVKGVVLDLRGNPGGYLDSAVDVSSLWLDKGKVVVQQKRGGNVLSKEVADGNNILKGLPTMVLINAGSASASEIVAGALRDHKAATLVGSKSFGKGSVQSVENLPGGAELKVTIARWHTPSGKNIDKEGVPPDVQVENSEADDTAGKDTQKDRAYELLRQKMPLSLRW